MDTTTNLLVILMYLSALYTALGVLCAVIERAQALLARPQPRRRSRKAPRRRTPKRSGDAARPSLAQPQAASARVRPRTVPIVQHAVAAAFAKNSDAVRGACTLSQRRDTPTPHAECAAGRHRPAPGIVHGA